LVPGLAAAASGIQNLTPGLTARLNYELSGLPIIHENVNPMENIPSFATGGSPSSSMLDSSGNYDYGKTNESDLKPGLTKAEIGYMLAGLPGNLIGKADGGSIISNPQAIEHPSVPGHNPQFYSEGGLSAAHRYVKGAGDGTSDSIPAMLANGEFVIPADIVSSLGNGSNDSGAKVLDEFLKTIRSHKHKADAKHLPPDSKGPLAYLINAKRKVKA
jgi:hypothetical protein